MAKRIADETFQISFRIDMEQLHRVDEFRERMGAAVGSIPQRSDIMRTICDLGIDAFERENKVLQKRAPRSSARRSSPAKKILTKKGTGRTARKRPTKKRASKKPAKTSAAAAPPATVSAAEAPSEPATA